MNTFTIKKNRRKYIGTPNSWIVKTRIVIRNRYERYMVRPIDRFVKGDKVIHFCLVKKFYNREKYTKYNISQHVYVYRQTYWWISCWICQRLLKWCKMQQTTKSVCSWVWAVPNRCCILFPRPSFGYRVTMGRYDIRIVLFTFLLYPTVVSCFWTAIIQQSSVVRVAIVRSKGYINRSSIDRRHVLCDNLFTRKKQRKGRRIINNK